jgi:DNA-binding NtrC family response regulator
MAPEPPGQSPSTASPNQPEAQDLLQIRVGALMSEVEEAYIRLALRCMGNNRRRTAELLGISLHTLYNKLRLYKEEEAKGIAAD